MGRVTQHGLHRADVREEWGVVWVCDKAEQIQPTIYIPTAFWIDLTNALVDLVWNEGSTLPFSFAMRRCCR